MYRIVVLSRPTGSWSTAFKGFYDELRVLSGISLENNVPLIDEQKTIEDVIKLAEKHKILIKIVEDNSTLC